MNRDWISKKNQVRIRESTAALNSFDVAARLKLKGEKKKMMSRSRFCRDVIGISSLVCVLMTQVVFAKEYKLDSSHSSVGFVIRHVVSRVPGSFRDFDAKLSFDPEHPEKAKVEATVKASSVNTENKKRDEHLQSDDFFAAKKFPTLTFVSTKVVSNEGKKYKMTGDLTMRGITKPVTFDVEFLGEANDPWGGHRAGFVATTKVNRKDFGINWNKALDNGGVVLSDDVEINLNIEAVEKSPAKHP